MFYLGMDGATTAKLEEAWEAVDSLKTFPRKPQKGPILLDEPPVPEPNVAPLNCPLMKMNMESQTVAQAILFPSFSS